MEKKLHQLEFIAACYLAANINVHNIFSEFTLMLQMHFIPADQVEGPLCARIEMQVANTKQGEHQINSSPH